MKTDRATYGLTLLFAVVSGIGYHRWQKGIEFAQVAGGVVRYPDDFVPGHVFGGYWTLVNQVGGLLLAAGMPDTVESVLLQIEIACCYALGSAMILRGLGAGGFATVAASQIGLLAGLMQIGPDYPSWPYANHTHGATAQGLFILVFGLLAIGRTRGAGLTAGLLVSVHPVVGAATVAGLAVLTPVAGCWESAAARRRLLTGLAIGGLISLASWAVWRIGNPAPIADAANAPYMRMYLSVWDDHRNFTIGMWQGAGMLVIAITFAAAVWRLRRPEALPPHRRLVLVAAALAAAGALVIYVLFHALRPWLPEIILLPMPARLASLVTGIAWPLLAGLLLRHGTRDAFIVLIILGSASARLVGQMGATSLLHQWLTKLGPAPIFLVGGAVILAYNPVRRWLERHDEGAAMVAMTALSCGLVAAEGFWRASILLPEWWAPAAAAILAALAAALWSLRGGDRRLALAVALAALPGAAVLQSAAWTEPFPFWTAVSRAGPAIAVAHPVEDVQLHTRLPVVLYGELNYLPYVGNLAIRTAEIVQDLYGTDFFNPPDTMHGWGRLRGNVPRRAWEERTGTAWACAAHRYRFAGVVAPADWELQLPRVAEGRYLALWLADARLCPNEGT